MHLNNNESVSTSTTVLASYTFDPSHCKNIETLDAIWNFWSFILFTFWLMWLAYLKVKSSYEGRLRTNNRFIVFPQKMLFLLYVWMAYSAFESLSAWMTWFTGGGWNSTTLPPLLFYLCTVIGHLIWAIVLFYKKTYILSFFLRIILFILSATVFSLYAHIFAPTVVAYIPVIVIDAYELLANGLIVYQKFMIDGVRQSIQSEIAYSNLGSSDQPAVVTHRGVSSREDIEVVEDA